MGSLPVTLVLGVIVISVYVGTRANVTVYDNDVSPAHIDPILVGVAIVAIVQGQAK
jgi:hypothetical protein